MYIMTCHYAEGTVAPVFFLLLSLHLSQSAEHLIFKNLIIQQNLFNNIQHCFVDISLNLNNLMRKICCYSTMKKSLNNFFK